MVTEQTIPIGRAPDVPDNHPTTRLDRRLPTAPRPLRPKSAAASAESRCCVDQPAEVGLLVGKQDSLIYAGRRLQDVDELRRPGVITRRGVTAAGTQWENRLFI